MDAKDHPFGPTFEDSMLQTSSHVMAVRSHLINYPSKDNYK